jgi:hypothetical protein
LKKYGHDFFLVYAKSHEICFSANTSTKIEGALFMKNWISLCFLATAFLLSRPALANMINMEDTPVSHCFKSAMPHELIPAYGNRDYLNWWQTHEAVLDTISETDALVAFIPDGLTSSIQDGIWQTAQGSVPYENRSEIQCGASVDLDKMLFQINYKNTQSNSSVFALLISDSGAPYLAAQRHSETSCHVDSYGRKVCDKPVVTYSQWKTVVPKDFKAQITLMNAATKLPSQFQFDNEKYRNCLNQIHSQP